MAQIASRMTWVFGTDPNKGVVPTEGNRNAGASNHVLGSTGAGVAFDTLGWGREFTFLIESNDSAMTYQIRTARTSSGPWAVLSSGAMTSTSGQAAVYNVAGPLAWLSPRVDGLASTASYVVIRMTAIDG